MREIENDIKLPARTRSQSFDSGVEKPTPHPRMRSIELLIISFTADMAETFA